MAPQANGPSQAAGHARVHLKRSEPEHRATKRHPPNCRQRVGLQHKTNPVDTTCTPAQNALRSRTAPPHPHKVTCRLKTSRTPQTREKQAPTPVRSTPKTAPPAHVGRGSDSSQAPHSTDDAAPPGSDFAKNQNARRPTPRPRLPPRSRAVPTAAKWPRLQSGRRGSRTPLARSPWCCSSGTLSAIVAIMFER